MRIAFMVGPFPIPSETFVLSQIVAMIERGHEVDIYADRPADPQPGTNELLTERTHYRPVKPRSRFVRLIRGIGLFVTHLRRGPIVLIRSLNFFRFGLKSLNLTLLYAAIPVIGSDRYDIVHCHFGPNGAMGAMLRDIGAVTGPVITTFHGYDVTRLDGRAEHYQYLFAVGDHFTVNSAFLAGRLEALGCPAGRTTRLPMGVDLERFRYQPRRPRGAEPVTIISVARLVEQKGLEYALRAVASVAAGRSLRYWIVGDGPERARLEGLIEELGLVGIAQVLGWRTPDELAELYDAAHLFLLTPAVAAAGDEEGQGLVLQEAQAAGLPVVATDHGAIREGVVDGKSGYTVPERDVDAIGGALVTLLDDPDSWAEMGRSGREFVAASYDAQVLHDRLEELYARIRAGPGVIGTTSPRWWALPSPEEVRRVR